MTGAKRGAHLAHLALLFIFASLLPYNTNGLEFQMSTQQKCIYEEIKTNVIVVGEFSAFNKETQAAQIIDLRVEDPYGVLLHETVAQTSGSFAFTTKVQGEYKSCFTVRHHHEAINTRIKLDWKMGVAATDWNAIAKKEHLDALTVELRRLEDSIREVYSDMLQLQQREQEMRDTSEATNARVAWYSVYSLLVCIASGIWQLWYLRRFLSEEKAHVTAMMATA